MVPEDALDARYHKILVAHFSPQNGCFARDGEPLFPPAIADNVQLKRRAPYYFLSVSDRKTRSKFGWVASVPEFSLRDFIMCNSTVDPNANQVRVLEDLFAAISGLPDGTPVAGSFFNRGVEQRSVVISFHKVFLYPAKSVEDEEEADEDDAET